MHELPRLPVVRAAAKERADEQPLRHLVNVGLLLHRPRLGFRPSWPPLFPRSIPMEKLDGLVADHLEQRLLKPERLEEILSSILTRREERAERRATHVAELRKRAAEAEGKLKRLYDAIESGVADLADPLLKDRVAELKAFGINPAPTPTARRRLSSKQAQPSPRKRSRPSLAKRANGCATGPAAIAATISGRSPKG